MSKRRWNQFQDANEPCPADWNRQTSDSSATLIEVEAQHDAQAEEGLIPVKMSRKIKACAACRRHKIKCLIDDAPPCRRCAKHKLQCVVSKNLQTIIDEKAQYTNAISDDLEDMHDAIQTLLKRAGLPELQVLRTSLLRAPRERLAHPDKPSLSAPHGDIGLGPSRDKSPEVLPEEDSSLPHIPIRSLYALTKLRSLRSPVTEETHPNAVVDDFISRGKISEAEAERLFELYQHRLDAFIFKIGCRYSSLTETRRKSPILAVTILTIAALHDLQSDDTYTTCSAELRRLVSLSIFDRCADRDYLRAMCLASYWLSDISWMISGHAIRRASECDLHNQHGQAVEHQSQDAADGARLWFILRVCDQRLATLYGRPAIVHEDSSVHEIESFLESPISNDQDRRLMGQVALLNIFKSVREAFGPDKGKPIPRAYLHQIAHFNTQLDDWLNHWSNTVAARYEHIGPFPRKAVRLHFHFAKLHLYSHVFRGLSAGQPIPHYFMDSTAAAIQAATSVIDFILNDPDVSTVLVGIPTYLHCMTAFACMFLIKVALKYGRDLADPDYVWGLTTRLVHQFRSVPAGKWHLTKLMAPGLERMASTLNPAGRAPSIHGTEMFHPGAFGDFTANGSFLGFEGDFLFDYNMNLGLSPIFPDLGTMPQAS